MHCIKYFSYAAVFSCFIVTSNGHGRLVEPPSRASMWRYGYGTPIDYNDNQLYCGGFNVQYGQNGGKCGVCGDNWADSQPRKHEGGGQYGKGIIARTYTQGQTIGISVEITASHKGWFEFRLCPHDNPSIPVTQDCLDQHLLKFSDGSTRVSGIESANHYNYNVELPADVTCSQCVLQWKYNAGNSWGVDTGSGTGCLGCGNQEQFYGCADVKINPTETDDSMEATSSTTTTSTSTSSTTESTSTSTSTSTTQSTSTTTSTTPSSIGTSTTESQSTTTQSSTASSSTQPTSTESYSTTTQSSTASSSTQPTSTESQSTTTQSSTASSSTQPTSTESQSTTTQSSTASSTTQSTSTESPSTTTESSTNCRAAGLYIHVPGMTWWCGINCAAGFCPASHCVCGQVASRRKRGLSNQSKGSIAEVDITMDCVSTQEWGDEKGVRQAQHWCQRRCTTTFVHRMCSNRCIC